MVRGIILISLISMAFVGCLLDESSEGGTDVFTFIQKHASPKTRKELQGLTPDEMNVLRTPQLPLDDLLKELDDLLSQEAVQEILSLISEYHLQKNRKARI